MIKKAIIPAAGYGTRSLPITKVLPKEMLPICGRPAIDFLVNEAIEAGIEQILIVVSRSKNMILDYFDKSIELEVYLKEKNKENLLKEIDIPPIRIQYVRQPVSNGLGDAILLGEQFIGNEPFAVMLPDEIMIGDKSSLLQLIEFYKEYKGNIIGLKRMKTEDLNKYGVVQPEEIDNRFYKILDIIEKPETLPPSNLAVIGRYILEPKIFESLKDTPVGLGGELQLTDGIKNLINTSLWYGKEIEGKRFDIATLSDYVDLINFIYKSNYSGS